MRPDYAEDAAFCLAKDAITADRFLLLDAAGKRPLPRKVMVIVDQYRADADEKLCEVVATTHHGASAQLRAAARRGAFNADQRRRLRVIAARAKRGVVRPVELMAMSNAAWRLDRAGDPIGGDMVRRAIEFFDGLAA